MEKTRETIFLSADMPDVQQRIEAASEGAEIIFGMGLYENLVLSLKPGQTYRSIRHNGAYTHILKNCLIRYPSEFTGAVIRDLFFLSVVKSEDFRGIQIPLSASLIDCRFVYEDPDKIAARQWENFQEMLESYEQRFNDQSDR